MQKYTKAQIDQMINEEFQRIMKQRALKSRLAQINEELSTMDSEDSLLNEVEAAGEEKVSSHAWTGEANGDVKYKPKFEKIGTHLKEEEGEEAIEEAPMGEFEAKFAEIGRAIDAKMAAEMADAPAEEPVMGDADSDDEDFEEVDVEDGDDNGSEEIEEGGYKETHQDETGKIVTAGDVQESVEEPLEGESVAQMTDADTVNDNMEKDTHVNEGKKTDAAIISEGTKAGNKNIFTEGIDAAKKAKLMEEMNRMRKFAGLSRDEE